MRQLHEVAGTLPPSFHADFWTRAEKSKSKALPPNQARRCPESCSSVSSFQRLSFKEGDGQFLGVPGKGHYIVCVDSNVSDSRFPSLGTYLPCWLSALFRRSALPPSQNSRQAHLLTQHRAGLRVKSKPATPASLELDK